MADVQSVSGKKSGVSPARKAVSTVILVLALIVLAIELRAGLGFLNSGKALEARSEDGAFENMTHEEALGLLSFSPSESVLQDEEQVTVYRYSWFSLLRPLMGRTQPELFLVVHKNSPPVAVSYYTNADDDPHQQAASLLPDGEEAAPPVGMSMQMTIEAPAGGAAADDRPVDRPAAEGDAPADEPAKNEAAKDEPGADQPATTPDATPDAAPNP